MKNNIKLIEKSIIDEDGYIRWRETQPIKMIKTCATCVHCSNGNGGWELKCHKRESELYLKEVPEELNSCQYWESIYLNMQTGRHYVSNIR